MKKREIIATLIDVSNDLDSIGMFAEADILTKTAESFGNLSPIEPESNPDNDATEYGLLAQEPFVEDLERENALIEMEERIAELQNNQHPTNEDLLELEKLLNVKTEMSKNNFFTRLQDAGAEVIHQDLNDPFRNE